MRRRGVSFSQWHAVVAAIFVAIFPFVSFWEREAVPSKVHRGHGAPLEDRTPEGTISEKTGPKYWNRIYHQKPDGTFEDVTEKAGLQGRATGGLRHGCCGRRLRQRRLWTSMLPYGAHKPYDHNGDGTSYVTEKAGRGSGRSASAAWSDLDDGLPVPSAPRRHALALTGP